MVSFTFILLSVKLSCDFDPNECLFDMRLDNSWIKSYGYDTMNNPFKPRVDANRRRSDGMYE